MSQPPQAGPGQPPPPTPDQMLMQMATGKWISRALGAVASLRIADQLKDGPVDAATLATRTSSNADALYRTLRALSAIGVFAELPERRFGLTPMSEFLRSDHPRSARALCDWVGEEEAWRFWADYEYTLRTGESAAAKAAGMPLFDWLKTHPRTAKVFNDAMSGMSVAFGEAVARGYDFSALGSLVDVGGGHGLLLAAIVKQFPALKATVFDLPEVVAGAPAALAAHGMEGKVEVAAGSFFEGVPAGADAYIMKAIIHDWDDDHCITILEHCRKALKPGGKVLIVEQVINDRPDGVFGKLVDLEMLIMTHGGRERTESEFAALVQRAGLKISRIVPTQSPACIVECVSA